MANEYGLQSAVVSCCDDYIADARRRLANLVQATGEGGSPDNKSPQPRHAGLSLIEAHEALLKGKEKVDPDEFDRKFHEWAKNRLSTCSYSSVYTTVSLKSAQSAPALPRRSVLRPQLMPDKLKETTSNNGFRSRQNNKALKERLEQLSLDTPYSSRAKRVRARRAAMAKRSKPEMNLPSRSHSSGSFDSTSSPDTPALSDDSSHGRKSSASSIESPATPTDVDSGMDNSNATKTGEIAPSRSSLRRNRGERSNENRKVRYTTTSLTGDRISFPSPDHTSLFSSTGTAVHDYENPRNSVPAPINKTRPELARISSGPRPMTSSAAVPRPLDGGLLAGPEYRNEYDVKERTVVRPSVCFFDDSSDNENEDLEPVESKITDQPKRKPSLSKKRASITSSKRSDKAIDSGSESVKEKRSSTRSSSLEGSSVAGGYAHIKNGEICHSPAYMRVSPEAASKARKALDQKRETQVRKASKQSFLQMLLAILLCSSSKQAEEE